MDTLATMATCKKAGSTHLFSMTCKVDAVEGQLATRAGRADACRWMQGLGIAKLYLETYRHGRFVRDAGLLQAIRDDFRARGFEVCGCITPTQMSRRVADWKITTCFTDPTAHALLAETARFTAALFDAIIIDDFFFSSCTCPDCETHRRGRPWGEARGDLLREVAVRHLIGPARDVNPRVQFIIKYPCWYETYYRAGYDVTGQTRLFDKTWIGTETRDPESLHAGRRPQTAASWIQGWMNAVSQGKCGGGWYDPIDTSPLVFVEQARQTILGGARESLLHCFDYLGTSNPGVVIHGGDLQIAQGAADADAFRRELPGLRRLAALVGELEPEGVLLPKQPNDDPAAEAYLPGFIGLLGVPVLPAASLQPCRAALLAVQAAAFDGLETFVADLRRAGTPLVVTGGLLARHPALAAEAGPGFATLEVPVDLWQLTTMPRDALDALRNRLLAPFGLAVSAPSRVSLHLFRRGPRRLIAVENFNDGPVPVRLTPLAGHPPLPAGIALALPGSSCARVQREAAGAITLELAARALAALEASAS